MLIEENVRNERLRRARHLKGWTQSELAERLGSDFETVSRWERGFTVPNAYYREKLCGILGKTAEELGLILDLQEPLLPHTSSYVFLASAYADTENEIVTQLKVTLQARGIPVVSNRTLRRQGAENKTKALQEAIRAAQVVLLIASLEARSSRSVQEALQLARIYKNRVCVVWIDGEHWQDCIPKDNGEFFAILDVRKNIDNHGVDEIIAALRVDQPTLSKSEYIATTINAMDELPIEPRNPYKGLKAFRGEDRGDFFGRNALIDEMVGAIRDACASELQGRPSARLLTVVGPSGSGKSSVVMAGLLPCLQNGGLPGSHKWIYLEYIKPGVHPIEALAQTLSQHLPDRSFVSLCEDLQAESSRGFHLLANRIAGQVRTHVVLLIDQFEELFTQTSAVSERQQFIDLVVSAVTEPFGSLIVLVTLRADFSDRPMHYPALHQLMEAHRIPVSPMEVQDLRSVIEKPASLPDVRLIIEPDLVGDLLFEMRGQMGALPLLQFTLDQLFRGRKAQHVTAQAYHELGGIKGALSKHAEETYAALPSEEHRRLTRTLFVRLIDPGATEQDTTRRRATRSEFSLENPTQTRLLQETMEAFIEARLLTTNEFAETMTIEVSHEALIREWPRFSAWLRDAREDIQLQQAMSEDVATWVHLGKPRDRLYRRSQLKEARSWAARNIPSRDEVAFLCSSTTQQRRMRLSVIAFVLLFVLMAGVLVQFMSVLRNVRGIPNPTVVTTLNEFGPGSLQQAIDTVNPGSTITFDKSLRGTITLTGNLDIPKSLGIRGPGGGVLSITSSNDQIGEAPGMGYAVQVHEQVIVTISGLTFKSDMFENSGSPGRGIVINDGSLKLINCNVIGNGHGGGIINNNANSTLNLINSIVSGNRASGASGGGGIYNRGGMVTLTNSTVSGNTASYDGGGIFNYGGEVTLINSTVSGNTASGDGGGISTTDISSMGSLPPNVLFGATQGASYPDSSLVNLVNSTISGNTASGNGGGISTGDISTIYLYSQVGVSPLIGFSLSSSVNLTSSTISGNTASGNGGGISTGNITTGSLPANGISIDSTLKLINSTVSDNAATGSGGGFEIIGNQADIMFCTIIGNTAHAGGGILLKDHDSTFGQIQMEIRNSIIAENHSRTNPDISGVPTSQGYNLIQNMQAVTFTSNLQHSTDRSVSDTDLAKMFATTTQLKDTHNPVKTYILLPSRGNPAIDKNSFADMS